MPLRTTLTLDDDVAKDLREEARRTGRSFKDVVNETLRRGLGAGKGPGRRPRRFRVRAKACGFRSGIDLMKLNQLVDELDIDRVGALALGGR